MPSDRKKKAAAAKTAKGKAAAKKEDVEGVEDAEGVEGITDGVQNATIEDNGRSCTGILASHPQSRDIHIESFTLLFHGHDLLVDASLELNYGR